MSNETSQQNNLWNSWSRRFSGKVAQAESLATSVAGRASKIRVAEPGALSVFSDHDLFGFERTGEGPAPEQKN